MTASRPLIEIDRVGMTYRTESGSVDLVNTYMGLAKKVDCKDVYTTEFLTKVAMPVAVK